MIADFLNNIRMHLDEPPDLFHCRPGAKVLIPKTDVEVGLLRLAIESTFSLAIGYAYPSTSVIARRSGFFPLVAEFQDSQWSQDLVLFYESVPNGMNRDGSYDFALFVNNHFFSSSDERVAHEAHNGIAFARFAVILTVRPCHIGDGQYIGAYSLNWTFPGVSRAWIRGGHGHQGRQRYNR